VENCELTESINQRREGLEESAPRGLAENGALHMFGVGVRAV
jgi:hypothetical protein